jgi:hypothetical protein
MARADDVLDGESGWIAVRCVVRHDDADGPLYEERITVWRSGDVDAAMSSASRESERYARALGAASDLGFAQAYRLTDTPGDGAEVFSLVRASPLSPGDYLSRFFATGEESESAADW